MAANFSFGETTIRGVNAGGWLVLEPWITPSLFEDKPEWVIDEKTYGQYWRETNYTEGFDEISAHWRRSRLEHGSDTHRVQVAFSVQPFFTCADDHLDLGFAVWSLIPLEQEEPFMTGAFNYLRSAVQWAQDVGLHVDARGLLLGSRLRSGMTAWCTLWPKWVLDLGFNFSFDNSGQAGAIGWFSNSTSITRSLAAIAVLTSEFITSKYGQTVIAIELVNEAFPTTKEQIATLEQFYKDGYEEVRKFGDQPVVLLSEAYQSLGFWSGFMPQPQYNKVALDVVLEQPTWKAERADDWDFQSGITYGWIPQPLDAKPHG
ncbi:hypothetical protein QFC20_006845 [Naganishia adeliensis]|uniref:Uncharacterized protein n=1 Tax=Naganishia adeliensis TaxID=92952 RepID=A0ACC2V6P9_9TREE|nr:hypothetical protein QFC20_006845 [Naganishia adeliensis]